MILKKRGKLILGIIQLFVAIGALPAGYSLIVEPDGSGLGMSLNLLSGSPFNDFFIPGLFLFVVNGIFNLAGSILAFCNFRLTPFLGFGLGIALLIWISVQVYSVGLNHILQPVYFIIGILEIILSIYLYRSKSQDVI